jgi:NTP pyrophosphatase (non-canonical NTP hydrolase)
VETLPHDNPSISLDDLYRMVAYIYSEQNAQRPASATFAHFVEVCGMLTVHDRRKKREGFTVEGALCKALGWYFPLLAKFKVRSVEEVVYRKYPHVCPYCRLPEHNDAVCKTVHGTDRTVDHAALRRAYNENSQKRPKSLGAWQLMFQEIYPRRLADSASRNILGLMEEIGELGEAIRVFDRYPKYFAGEAADVFSYIMGFANAHMLTVKQEGEGQEFSFEDQFLKRYPGICVECGYQVCVCPLVPESTVGRLAKELDLAGGEDLFALDEAQLRSDGLSLAEQAIIRVGGYPGLVERFPFDRGEANRELVVFCLKLAAALENDNPKAANSLRGAAIRIGLSATFAGSRKRPAEVAEGVQTVRKIMLDLGDSMELGDALGVSATPGRESVLPFSSIIRSKKIKY